MSDLFVCMRDVISEFNSEIKGSLAFCALMSFLCSIVRLILIFGYLIVTFHSHLPYVQVLLLLL